MRITTRQLKGVVVVLAAASLVVWQGFVYYAAKHPLPAGTCVSGYGDCVVGSTFWGNVVWGSMGLFVVFVPGWGVILFAILLARYIGVRSRHKVPAKS